MKKVNRKLSLNKSVISTLNNVKAGDALISQYCPSFYGASCPYGICGEVSGGFGGVGGAVSGGVGQN